MNLAGATRLVHLIGVKKITPMILVALGSQVILNSYAEKQEKRKIVETQSLLHFQVF